MTKSELRSHAIAVLQIANMGAANRWINPRAHMIGFDFSGAVTAGLVESRDELLGLRLTPLGRHLAAELLAVTEATL
jgi:hypothetical protein